MKKTGLTVENCTNFDNDVFPKVKVNIDETIFWTENKRNKNTLQVKTKINKFSSGKILVICFNTIAVNNETKIVSKKYTMW